MTPDQLRQIMTRCPLSAAKLYADPLTSAMTEFAIDRTDARIAAFLGQLAQESGELRYVCEIASGEAYECRADLGNCKPGDGERFKGRGLMQITGRTNYLNCSLALFGDDRLLREPDLLEQPIAAADSAGWFWETNGLNELADNGDFEAITRRINGGLTGYGQRVIYWRRAQKVLQNA